MSCFRYHKGTDFQANHNAYIVPSCCLNVVLDTTKVQIFKQITTYEEQFHAHQQLFQIPQRYRFSSKSQHQMVQVLNSLSCFRYHKGTDFQANHNVLLQKCNKKGLFQIPQRYRFSSKSQRTLIILISFLRCFRYHKGTDFQANHNNPVLTLLLIVLFQIPQRYRFSSKSQPDLPSLNKAGSCFRYHKGTDFQANHNECLLFMPIVLVVLDTTKVQIFKQITTRFRRTKLSCRLFQIPQRYRFSSKSQHLQDKKKTMKRCFRYHKGTDFQANHNKCLLKHIIKLVVLDTTKVQIFKQITTECSETSIR